MVAEVAGAFLVAVAIGWSIHGGRGCWSLLGGSGYRLEHSWWQRLLEHSWWQWLLGLLGHPY